MLSLTRRLGGAVGRAARVPAGRVARIHTFPQGMLRERARWGALAGLGMGLGAGLVATAACASFFDISAIGVLRPRSLGGTWSCHDIYVGDR